MNGPLTPDAAERMLRGEPTGPPALADLLAEAAATPVSADPVAEEAAVAAFRVARLTGPRPRPRARRRPRLLTFKTALLGLVLAGAGGVTAATVAAHQAEPPARRQAPATHQSVDSSTTGTHGAATMPPGGPQTATPRTTAGATTGAKAGEKTNAGQGAGNGKQNGHATTKPRPTKKPKGSSKGKGHG